MTAFIPEIVDQHNEHGASLWTIRDRAVHGPSFNLSDLIKLDERIEAHIDGLRVAEIGGWSASPKELERGEAGSFFVQGILAVESGDTARFDEIIELSYASGVATQNEPYHPAYDPWRGLVSALAWTEPAHARVVIERLLDTPRPRTRWLGLASSSARRTLRVRGLETALADREPLVRARAARTMGELGSSKSRLVLNSLLADHDDNCRFWAAWSVTLLGTTEGLEVLAEIARKPGPWCEPALDLLLRRLPIERANGLILPLGRDTRRRRTAIRATATIGDPLYVPWLIGQIADVAVARCAGEALATITGIEPDDVSPDRLPDVETSPNDDPDDDSVILGEDEGLPWLDQKKCRRWWEANNARFRIGIAYFQGEPKPSVSWLRVLAESGQRRRRAAAIELALLRPGQAMFEIRARGDLQRRRLTRA